MLHATSTAQNSLLRLNTVQDLQQALAIWKTAGKRIGFVPTMGALHEGHLSLVAASKQKADVTIVSIFVNPLQFNNPNDLAAYPRTLDTDLQLLENAGVDGVYCPSELEMYRTPVVTRLQLGTIATVLEGAFRPGHFEGMATVVIKLFNLVRPDHVFFGQKDLQQCYIIKQLLRDFSYPITMHIGPTMRAADGLALSSRNTRLQAETRKRAPILYDTLQTLQQQLATKPFDIAQKEALWLLENAEFKTEYLALVQLPAFEPVTHIKEAGSYALCIAGSFDQVRLIDNIVFNT